MSAENEKQIEFIPKPVCRMCETVIADDDIKLICTNDQCNTVTCSSCIKKMIDVMYGQPTLNYPFKCSVCSHVFDQAFFLEFIIKHEQYEKYIACIFPLYWTKDCLEENEVLVQCK